MNDRSTTDVSVAMQCSLATFFFRLHFISTIASFYSHRSSPFSCVGWFLPHSEEFFSLSAPLAVAKNQDLFDAFVNASCNSLPTKRKTYTINQYWRISLWMQIKMPERKNEIGLPMEKMSKRPKEIPEAKQQQMHSKRKCSNLNRLRGIVSWNHLVVLSSFIR